ncbi:MAG: hypothetical protein KDD92_14680 [Caldilineaceae bacterium]|nr:hypothetical protein [Caldilineaceae bacterium]
MFIPAQDAYTSGALYYVTHNGQLDAFAVNQAVYSGAWVDLAALEFAADGQENVILEDVVPEQSIAAVRIGFDAIKFTLCDDPAACDVQFPALAPPLTAAQLQRLRDLGIQPYQVRGADPVSFSTGNYSMEVPLFSLPGVGDQSIDMDLVYNSQDFREDRLGYGWSFPYNARAQHYSDNSVSITLADGRTYLYTADGDGYTRPDGVFAELTREDDGNLRWEDPLGTTLIFTEHIYGIGVLNTWIDRQGNELTFEHDLSVLSSWLYPDPVPIPPLLSITDQAGQEVTFESDDDGHITQAELPDGRTFHFTYDDEANLTEIQDANGGTRRYEYDDSHRIIRHWDPENIMYLENIYDDEDRVIEQIDASGTHLDISYDDDNKITTFTDNLGNISRYYYDDLNRVIQSEDALGNSEHTVYDDQYNIESFTDKNGNTWTYTYDDAGNMLSVTDPLGYTTYYAYNDTNDLTGIIDPLGRTTAYEYNEDGRTTRIIFPDGVSQMAAYNEAGDMLTLTDANGHIAAYFHDSTGNLQEVIDPLGNITSYAYDATGRMTQMTDANGHNAQFVYDGNDNVTRIVDPKGQATEFVYDLNDNLVQVTDRRGGVMTFEYDENLKLIRETDPQGHSTSYDYDLMYNRISMTDANGHTTLYRYDDIYQLLELEDALGNVTDFAYDANGNVTAVTDALNQISAYEYDALDRLVMMTDALGGETGYVYDEVSRLTSENNPRGAITRYEYDLRDRMVKTLDALNGEWTATYDAVGNMLSTADANGHTRAFVYDAADRLITETDAEGHATGYAYDGVGNIVTVTNPRGFATNFTYDANDNVVQITDARAGITDFAYDAEDNLTVITDPDGHGTSYIYDLDDLVIAVTDAENQTTAYVYDPVHNVTQMTNGNANVWSYAYDALNRPVLQTDPLQQTQVYTYDELGRQTSVTDESGVVTNFAYDALDRLITRTENVQTGVTPDAKTNVTTAFSYDAVDNLLQEMDGNGNPTTYAYDLLDRMTRSENAEQEVTLFAYDAVGNLITLTNPRGYATNFAYNNDDLLVQVTDALLGVTRFGYDANHNRTDITDANFIVTHSVYDELDRLSAEIRNHKPGEPGDSETNVTIAYAYNADSTLASMTDPNGNLTRYEYDGIHRLVTETDALDGMTHYEYDAVSNLLALIDANDHRTSYQYDALNRQVAMTDPEAHQETYGYDPVGNLVTLTNGRGFTTDFEYDNLYRMTRMVDAKAGTVLATHDAMGNVLSLVDQNGHPQTFAYDKVYRVLSHTDAEGYVTAFGYDENGNRTSLTDGNGHLTQYVFDELDRLSAVINAEDETTSFVYDPVGNQIDMRENDGVVTHYEYDPIYRLSGVIQNYILPAQADHETNVPYGYDYDANGNLTSITDPLAHITRFQYDALDRMVQEVNPLDNVWEYGYDPVDNLVSRLDANGDLTQYAYTADGLPARISYPDGTGIDYAYDANHNLVEMVDSLGTSTWTFDELDRITQAVDAHNRTLGYAYDPVGNRTSVTYPDGNTVTYAYLDNDWLRRVELPDDQWTEYAKDGVGLTTSIVNSNSTVTEQSYDKANRMLSTATVQTSGAQKTVSSFQYTLDDVGQRIQTVAEYGWRNPPVVTTDYTYDPIRRLVRSQTDEGVWTQYGFDAAGNRLSLQTNDDALSPKPFDEQTLSYTYNDANQLLSVLDETSGSNGQPQKENDKAAQALYALRHEIAAQRGKHISENAADALTAAIDSLLADLAAPKPPKSNELAASIADLSDQVQAYRASGDIDNDGIANSLLAKLDKAGQAVSGGNGNGDDLQAQLFTYDANGNRINETWPGPQGPPIQGTDYAYDYENRLIQALNYQGDRVDRDVTTMQYDGLFRRLTKSYDPKQGNGGIKTTETLFDGLDPVAEYSLWNGQYADFYRGDLNRMVAMQSYPSSQMDWYTYDGLGSVTGLTGHGGQSVHDYRYTDYGLVAPVNGNWTEPHNQYTYTGQEWDNETELLHFYARDYDPVTGVWMQQDVYRGRLAEPMTLHRYGYVGGNPVSSFDYYGYVICGGACIGAAIVIGAKALDYGWTAYDIWQAQRTLSSDTASNEEKILAAFDLVLAGAFEGIEPDDLTPIGVPLDDVARKLAMKQIKKEIKENGVESGIRKARELFGDKVDDVLQKAGLHSGNTAARYLQKSVDDLLQGGHAIQRHGPQVSKQFLIDRLKKGEIPVASKFKSKTSMTDSIRKVLDGNSSEILDWATWSSSGQRKVFELDTGTTIGDGYKLLHDGQAAIQVDMSKIKVVLESKGDGGWFIVTAFPIP